MLTELYGTLYGHNNLPLCTMLKDIYAKKPQPTTATSTTTTPGATAPFTLKDFHQNSTQAHRRPFPGRESQPPY